MSESRSVAHETRGLRSYWLEAAFVVLLPPVLFVAYSVSPINQLTEIDANVYTGYIQNFSDLIARYGPTYYAVRFGLILPGVVFASVFGPEASYFALVFFFYLVAGVPLYLALRKPFGVAGACVGYLTFVSSVWVARTMLWQYVDSAVVAYLIGATAVILLDPERRRLAYVVAGGLFGLAVHANAFAAAFVVLAAIPYAIVNAGRIRPRLRADALCIAAGVAAVTLIGVLFFGAATGHWDIFGPSLRMVAGGPQISPLSRPPGWYLSTPWLLYPPFVLAAGGLLWLRAGARSRLLAAVLLYAAACSGFFLVWGLFGHAWSRFYYFSMLAASVMPAAAAILAALVTAGPLSTAQRVLAIALVALAPLGWVVLDRLALAVDRAAFLVAIALAWALVWLSPRNRAVAIAACAVFAGVSHLHFVAGFGRVVQQSVHHPEYARVFGGRDHEAWDAYRVTLRLISAMPKFAEDGEVLRFWYPADARDPSQPGKLDAMQSTYLWEYSRLHAAGRLGLPEIGQDERTRLSDGDFHLVLLADRREQLSEARAALRRDGLRFSSIFSRDLCAGARCVPIELLHFRPSGYRLSGGADAPGRLALAADAASLQTTLERNLYGWSGRDRALSLVGDRLVFRPTSERDHLATGFLATGEPAGTPQRAIRVTTVMPTNPAGRCRILLQSQAFERLGHLGCRPRADGTPDANVAEFALPRGVKAFRVVLESADGRPADLPSSLRVEVVEAKPS